MKMNELEKLAFKKEVTKLIQDRNNLKVNNDCYCLLMKQIFLSESTLN